MEGSGQCFQRGEDDEYFRVSNLQHVRANPYICISTRVIDTMTWGGSSVYTVTMAINTMTRAGCGSVYILWPCVCILTVAINIMTQASPVSALWPSTP